MQSTKSIKVVDCRVSREYNGYVYFKITDKARNTSSLEIKVLKFLRPTVVVGPILQIFFCFLSMMANAMEPISANVV